MAQQSLSTAAPDTVEKFKHHFSLAVSSKSDKQRQEGLAYLTSQLSIHDAVNPIGTHTLLSKLLPLVSDSATPVRSQLLKLFQTFPADQVRYAVEPAAMFIRAGMTHLSADISNDAINFMEWLLEAAREDLVSCPGGWVKTLNTFCAMLGWTVTAGKDGWTSGGRGNTARGKASLNQTRAIGALTQFLKIGFESETPNERRPGDNSDSIYCVTRDPNAFAYLNITGSRRDEDGEMYSDRESRQRVFHRKFKVPIARGLDAAKKEGGTSGRAAAGLDQLLEGPGGMGDYEPAGAIETGDLLNLW